MRKKILSLACVVLSSLIMIGTTQTLKATNTTDIADTSIEEEQNKQQELKEDIADAQKILGELEQLKSDTTAYISVLDEKMSKLTDYIIELNSQISDKEESIGQLNTALKNQEKDIAVQYEAMKKRIKYLYENGQVEYLDMILNSGNISEMLNKAEYLSKITEYDRDMLNKLKEAKEQIELTKATLQSEREELRNLKKQTEDEQAEVEILVEAKGQLLMETSRKIDSTQSSVETMEGELAASEAIEAELIELERKREEQRKLEEQRRLEEEKRLEEQRRLEEERKREAESKAALMNQNVNQNSDDDDTNSSDTSNSDTNKANVNGSGNNTSNDSKEDDDTDDNSGTSNSGKFKWPLPGYSYISSGFVHRINPVTGQAENHSGIDIPAPAGTGVHAGGSGVIVWANKNPSAGNWIGIDHGNGLYTVYMHMSAFNCSVGDVVKTGDVIGYVGSTGCSTGNHLHFSVRLNGSYVNPMSYLD